MNDSCAGHVKMVGDRLHLSSGCPSDQSSSLALIFLTLCFVYIFSIRWSKYLPPDTLFGFNQ